MTAALAALAWLNRNKNLWPVLVIAIMGVVIWVGHGELQERKAAAARAEALASQASAAPVEMKKANDDWRQAEAETPIDADREYFKRLCAQSASCALRSKYRAVYGGKR
jgi:hypothetical protein